MSLPVAILAGGLATRLQPVTTCIPKSLVDIDGVPFAVHQIELLRRHGITDITYLVGHLGDQMSQALGDGSRWGVRLRYSFDGPRLLGTGGAIRKALPQLSDPFFALYGDSYLDCDYEAIERAFVATGKTGLMTVYFNDGRFDRSNVHFSDSRLVRYDKHRPTAEMRHIDYGLGVLRHAAFAGRCDGEAFDLEAIYQDLLRSDELAAYEIETRFYEIGSPAGLEETRAHLRGTRVETDVHDAAIRRGGESR